MAKSHMDDLREYVDRYVSPRLRQMEQDKRREWIRVVVHESEL